MAWQNACIQDADAREEGRMNNLIKAGVLICVLCIIADRFIAEIPSVIAMPVYTAGVILIVAGMWKSRKN